MIAAFLKAKHWQLFLLMFAIPIVLQFILMGFVFSKILDNGEIDTESIIRLFVIVPFIMLFFIALFAGWFWSIAMGLQEKIPSGIKMKVNQFKVFFVTPVFYLFSILVIVVLFLTKILDVEIFKNNSILSVLFALIAILHLFSVFCLFHTLYFTAKTIKTVELQKEVIFEDFIAEFFLLWFYPIGIWILQPKINKIAEQETLNYSDNITI